MSTNDTPAPQWQPITKENPPQFPCWLWNFKQAHNGLWEHSNWLHVKHAYAMHPDEYSHWHPDQPTAPTAQPAGTGTPDAGATPRTDAAEKANTERFKAIGQEVYGMVATDDMAQLERELAETRAERDSWKANSVKLLASYENEDRAHSVTVQQRDVAEDAADKLTSAILGEPIDWAFHDAKWLEAIEQADALRSELAELRGLLEGGMRPIAEERVRQIKVEGWTEAHDDAHTEGDLADAAGCYALARQMTKTRLAYYWPWDFGFWKPTPENRERELVKAGALIVAELDRLARARLATERKEDIE